MLQSETKIRVRYGETDRMGYAYYGVYAQYYEVGRVETLRVLGFSYRDVEERGVLLPVVEYAINYKKPALYDEEITVVTRMEKPSGVRLVFHYECFNEKKELLNTGRVVLVCVDKKLNRPSPLPPWFDKAIQDFFPSNG